MTVFQGDLSGLSSPVYNRLGDHRRVSISDDAMLEAADGSSTPTMRRASVDVLSPSLCREASLDAFVAPAQVIRHPAVAVTASSSH